MFTPPIKNRLTDETGAVTIFGLFAIVILTIAGIAAVSISNNETSIVRNEQAASLDLYDAESAINTMRINWRNWFTQAFVDANPATASFPRNITIQDASGVRTVAVQARFIHRAATSDIPTLRHIGPIRPGPGYDLGKYQARHYVITATTGQNTTVQAGVWKVFNK